MMNVTAATEQSSNGTPTQPKRPAKVTRVVFSRIFTSVGETAPWTTVTARDSRGLYPSAVMVSTYGPGSMPTTSKLPAASVVVESDTEGPTYCTVALPMPVPPC